MDRHLQTSLDGLVERAKRGDRAAFDELVRRFRPRVYALALHLSGRASDADDIAQDAFIKAYRCLPGFEGRSQFFTWLYRITLNRALNVRRDAWRRPQVSLSDDRVVMALEVDAADDPRHRLELSETYALLLSALDELSESLRATVVLVALQGLSQREAAVVLDTSEGTIAWRMHEAKRRLQAAVTRLQREPTPLPVRRNRERFEELLSWCMLPE